MWEYTGQRRPPFAEEPGPGQESVWDYPRPPSLVSDARTIRVLSGAFEVAISQRGLRVCETASPPTFYIPATDVNLSALVRMTGPTSFCEWKGRAEYWSLNDDNRVIGWSYPEPSQTFDALREHFSFYPGLIACFVDDERVRPQPGSFYGGWITSDVVGPFKGEPGTGHW